MFVCRFKKLFITKKKLFPERNNRHSYVYEKSYSSSMQNK